MEKRYKYVRIKVRNQGGSNSTSVEQFKLRPTTRRLYGKMYVSIVNTCLVK